MALIDVCEPYNYIAAKHIAILQKGGKEDYNSDTARTWIGSLETYIFKEGNKGTNLTVDQILNGRKCLMMVSLML